MFYYLLINFSSLLHSFLFKFQLYFDIILVGEIHKLALSRNDIYLDIIKVMDVITGLGSIHLRHSGKVGVSKT